MFTFFFYLYPAEYLDFFISKQDTTFLDTTGISDNIKEIAITGRHYNVPEENLEDYWRFRDFIFYKKIGEELEGLSPGQAYLNRRKDMFSFKGYLNK